MTFGATDIPTRGVDDFRETLRVREAELVNTKKQRDTILLDIRKANAAVDAGDQRARLELNGLNKSNVAAGRLILLAAHGGELIAFLAEHGIGGANPPPRKPPQGGGDFSRGGNPPDAKESVQWLGVLLNIWSRFRSKSLRRPWLVSRSRKIQRKRRLVSPAIAAIDDEDGFIPTSKKGITMVDYDTSRGPYHAMLDRMARARQAITGESYAKAFTECYCDPRNAAIRDGSKYDDLAKAFDSVHGTSKSLVKAAPPDPSQDYDSPEPSHD
jgi:hypothetical protein